jgi:hypothetical protein
LLYQSLFWRQHVFTLVIISLVLFVVLTGAAMLFYPGGTMTDATHPGYSFRLNFFSELGFTVSHAGQPNTVSAALFGVALAMAGSGLACFFIAFPQFFVHSTEGKWLSAIGSLFGLITAICFIGVALSPANLYEAIHLEFVFLAFRAFPVAVFFYVLAIFRGGHYPKRLAIVFIAFGFLLLLYLLLIETGPSVHTPEGMMIQATGQKIIVYASIVSVLIQAFAAKGIARERALKDRRFLQFSG